MISRDLTLTVSNNKATLNEPVTLYKNDRGIVLNFTIKGYKFKFNRKTEYNLLRNSEVGIVGARVLVVKPDGSYFEIPMCRIEDDIVKVVIGKEWIDEDIEVGEYKLQIQLYGEDAINQRISIPPVSFNVENLICDIEDTSGYAIVGNALTDLSVVFESKEFEDNSDLPNGVYDKTTWSTGDVITSYSLNKIENAVDFSITELANVCTELDGKADEMHVHSYNDLTDKPTLLKGDKGDKGEKGEDGLTPNIQIGTVTTLEPDQQATIIRRGDLENPVFDFSIPKGEQGKESQPTLLVDYEHTSNKVVIPESLNLETGVYTTSEPHGLKGGESLLLFVNNNDYFNFDVTKIPNELWRFNWTTWYFPIVIFVSETEFKLKYNQTNNEITYSTADNGNLSFGDWGFQVAQNGISFIDGDFSKYKTLIFDVYAPNMNKGYTPNFDIFNKTLNKTFFGKVVPFIPESYDNSFSSSTYRNIVYKNTYYVVKFILEENKVRQEALRSCFGVTTNYRYMHPNLCVSDTDTFIHESYTDNVEFKNDIKLFSNDFKFLNGTRVRIYGQMEGRDEN